jgi:hypothetical protein
MKNAKLFWKYHGNFCSAVFNTGVIAVCSQQPLRFIFVSTGMGSSGYGKLSRGFPRGKKKLGNTAVEETKWLSILNYTKRHNYRQCQSVEFLNIMAGGICSYHWTLNCCIIFLLLTGVGIVVLSRV